MYFQNQPLFEPFASAVQCGAPGDAPHPYIDLRQPPPLCLWVPRLGKSPKFSDAFCYPGARCRSFPSLYISREGKESREKQSPDPKRSLSVTQPSKTSQIIPVHCPTGGSYQKTCCKFGFILWSGPSSSFFPSGGLFLLGMC